MGYLTLDEIPSGRICRPLFIPDDPLWLALFGGALTELEQPYNYQQFGTLTPQQMADACAEVIAQWYSDMCQTCELPTDDPILQVDENFELKELVNGEWVDASGDYYIPPPNARSEATADERRCAAAANAEAALADLYEQITDTAGEHLALLESIADIAVFLTGLLFPAAGLVYRALGALALMAFKIGFDAVEFVTADFWDAQFSRNLRCTLYNNSTDTAGVVTFDFQAVNDEIIAQIQWIDPQLGSFALAGQVRWMLYQLTPEVLNQMGTLTAVEPDNCDECDGPFCVLHDFNVDNYEWTVSAAAGWGDLAVYSPPFTDRKAHRVADGDDATFVVFQRYLNITSQFTRIEFDYDLSVGAFTAGAYTGVQIVADGVTVYDEVISGSGTLVWEPVTPFTGFLVFNCLLSYVNTGGSSSGSGSVSAVRFYGTGNPNIEFLLGVPCDVP